MPSGSNVRLMSLERLVERRPEHLLHERAAHQAVAVLARQRAAELEHEVGDVVGDRLERADAVVGLQVDHRPHVQAADRRVRVDAGRRAVPGDDRRETGRCSRAAAPARPPCPRRTTATSRRPSSPSTGRAPLRAGSRSWPARADRGRDGSDSRSGAPAGRARARRAAAAGPRPGRRRTRRTAALRDRRR